MARIDSMALIKRSLQLDGFERSNSWKHRHVSAWAAAAAGSGIVPETREAGIVNMILGWVEYGDAHYRHYNSAIGDDSVLGPGWFAIGHGIRVLLNGDLGRLDGGTLDSLLLDIAEHNGFTQKDIDDL